MPVISVVVPVYNAEKCLNELCSRLKESLTGINSYEVILIEDGGKDDSWKLIEQIVKSDPHFKGIKFSRNFGQHYGITAGLDYAKGDWVVVMDCDLQDKPEDITRLYEKAKDGFEMVIARRVRRNDFFLKRCSAILFYRFLNYLADIHYDYRIRNFRIMSRNVVENFRLMRENLRFFGGLVDWMGYPTAYIDVEFKQRFSGKSSYNFRSLCKLAIDTIVAYSDKPLRLSITFGFIISFLSFLVGIYVIYRKIFFGIPIMGWASLIVSLYFIGGIIITVLGIIGLYLGKAFYEIKKRPLYIISEKIGL
ncbi:MAG: glycosyltransferase family 2 protein [Candidatus Omnitrophica bacterium]|jgi:dolichol-phosphate mannosyltransferase|nr:glycosyltransferase family 2 protein [Candidatus Omnitrophota bacterium]